MVGIPETCVATVNGGFQVNGETITFSQTAAGVKVLFPQGIFCQISGASCLVKVTPQSSGAGSVFATYSGDANNLAFTGGGSFSVSLAATITSVTCAPTTVVVGQMSDCAATITGSFHATGFVKWTSL